MFRTLKKILEKEEKEKRIERDKDYYFDKEINILLKQRGKKEIIIIFLKKHTRLYNNVIYRIKFMIDKSTTGTYNLTNPGYICHNDILDMYTEIVDKDFKYKNFRTTWCTY